MAGRFYPSRPRNTNSGSSNPLLERKLDEILLTIRDQKNHMILLEEKGAKTLESFENLDARMSTLEEKMKFNEQLQATPTYKQLLLARPAKRKGKAKFLQNFYYTRFTLLLYRKM